MLYETIFLYKFNLSSLTIQFFGLDENRLKSHFTRKVY